MIRQSLGDTFFGSSSLGVKRGSTLDLSRVLNYVSSPAMVPVNTVEPSIAGIGYAGQTLTATAGTWDTGTATGQWYADDVLISGETASTYVVSALNNGAAFKYIETNTGVTAESNVVHHWTPADTSTTVWLNDNVTEVSGLASQWADDSGGNRHAVQASGALQPAYDADAFGTGKPGIVWPSESNSRELKYTGTFDVGTVAVFCRYGDGTETDFYAAYSGMFGFHAGDAGIGLIGSSSSAWYGVTEFKQHSLNGTLKNTTGAALPIDDDVFVAIRSAVVSATQLVIGGDRGISGRGWAGPIGEFIALPVVADAAMRQKLDGYLAHKWGATAKLDIAHPYKSSPPTV